MRRQLEGHPRAAKEITGGGGWLAKLDSAVVTKLNTYDGHTYDGHSVSDLVSSRELCFRRAYFKTVSFRAHFKTVSFHMDLHPVPLDLVERRHGNH